MRPVRLLAVVLLTAQIFAPTLTRAETTLQAQGPAGAPASAFPKPDRPVADIVSPTWGNAGERDAARETAQIAARLGLEPGMVLADIGAGDGYDSLRLARVVGPKGGVLAEDVTAPYLRELQASARRQGLDNVTATLGEVSDPRLRPASVDAAIMVHMYHEIAQPYALLYNLAPAFRPGARLGVEELDRPTARHGTPPALLVCEFAAVGYRKLSLSPLEGGLGYFAVFEPPTALSRPRPGDIRPCRAGR